MSTHLDPRTNGALGAAEVTDAVGRVLRQPDVRVLDWVIQPTDYPYGSPTTAGLFRARGQAEYDGQQHDWSFFIKIVRSYRHWPLLPVLPVGLREEALRSPAWRYEADLYASGLGSALPTGLRLPRLLGIKELPDEHLVLLLEDVVWDRSPWDLARFQQVAELLGRLAVRLTDQDALPATASREPGVVTRRFYTGRVKVAALPALRDDRVWTHPLLAAAAPELRPDLMELARRTPTILNQLERLPQAFIHGDASPQNLLVEMTPAREVVAIDWTLGGLAAMGDDLGQLLVGLAHAGSLSIDELPGIRKAIVAAYTSGVSAEGLAVDETTVCRGLDGGLVVRSAFTALPLERLAEPLTADLADLINARLQLTRYLVDLGLDLRF